ncbi:MAG: hypothetical protein ACFB2Z_14750 [Maricaulaceae bacterium]
MTVRIRKSALAMTLAFAVLGPSLNARAETFSDTVEDLPLMTGLSESDQTVVFETPQGRIAEVVAHGAVERAEIAVFYAQTLPQLGWRLLSKAPLAFERSGERLAVRIEPSAQDGQSWVRFHFTPAAQ